MPDPIYIMPAEFVGMARTDEAGYLDVGGVRIHYGLPDVGVYVRRASDDLSVMEVHLARHDGLAQEELDEQNRQAEIYPGGPEAYWGVDEEGYDE